MSKSIIACAFARGLYSFWEGVSAISARSYPRTNWFSTYTMLTLARIGLIDERVSSAQRWYLSTFFWVAVAQKEMWFQLIIHFCSMLAIQPTNWLEMILNITTTPSFVCKTICQTTSTYFWMYSIQWRQTACGQSYFCNRIRNYQTVHCFWIYIREPGKQLNDFLNGSKFCSGTLTR